MKLSLLLSFLNFGLKGSWILLPCLLHNSIPEVLILLIIITVLADTLGTTQLISLKAFTVKPKTFGLRTFATDFFQILFGSQGTFGRLRLLPLLRLSLFSNLFAVSTGQTDFGVQQTSKLFNSLWDYQGWIEQIVISFCQTALFKCIQLTFLINRIILDEPETLDLVADLTLATIVQVVSLGYVFEKCLGFTL